MPDGRYYASLVMHDGIEKPESSSDGKAIGVDLGLIDFAVTSNGSKFNNPLHLKKHERNLKRKQRKLSRKCDKTTNKRHKAKVALAKVYSKISRVREDFLHKLSRTAVATTGGTPVTRCLKIVNENKMIVLQALGTSATALGMRDFGRNNSPQNSLGNVRPKRFGRKSTTVEAVADELVRLHRTAHSQSVSGSSHTIMSLSQTELNDVPCCLAIASYSCP